MLESVHNLWKGHDLSFLFVFFSRWWNPDSDNVYKAAGEAISNSLLTELYDYKDSEQ